jgi:hypothetical protein
VEDFMLEQNLPSEWKSRFQKWQASGLSGRAWCLQNQISYGTFSYWRQKISSDPNLMAELNPETFVELSESLEGSVGLTLEYRGVTLCLSKKFNEDLLKRCLKALKEL